MRCEGGALPAQHPVGQTIEDGGKARGAAWRSALPQLGVQRVLVPRDAGVLVPQVGIEACPLAEGKQPTQEVRVVHVAEEALEIARSVCGDRVVEIGKRGDPMTCLADRKI